MSAAHALLMVAGLFSLAIAALHLGFWRLFRWREELLRLSRTNAALMQVMNLVLIGCLVLFGTLVLVHSRAMVQTGLGRGLLGGLGALWIARAAMERWFFPKRPRVTLGLEAMFVSGAVLHALPLWLTR